MIRLGALPVRDRRAQVGPVRDGQSPEGIGVEGDVGEPEIAGDLEVFRDGGGPGGAPQGDPGHVEGLPGVGRVALEGEALHLDAEQLQLGQVAAVDPQALQSRGLVESPKIVLRERELLAGHQRAGEGGLDLEDGESLHVLELKCGHPRRGAGRVDAPEALAPELDGLADREGVLDQGRAAAAELLGEVGRDRIRSQPRGDLAGAHRPELRDLGAHRRVLAQREDERLVERQVPDRLLREAGAGDPAERRRHHSHHRDRPRGHVPSRRLAHDHLGGHGGPARMKES